VREVVKMLPAKSEEIMREIEREAHAKLDGNESDGEPLAGASLSTIAQGGMVDDMGKPLYEITNTEEELKREFRHIKTAGGYKVGIIEFKETGRRVPYLIVPRSETDQLNLLKQFAKTMELGKPDMVVKVMGTKDTSYVEWARDAYENPLVRQQAMWNYEGKEAPVPDEVYREYASRALGTTASMMEALAETGAWIFSSADRRPPQQLLADGAIKSDVKDKGYTWICHRSLEDFPPHLNGLADSIINSSEYVTECPIYKKVQRRVVLRPTWGYRKASPFLYGDKLWQKDIHGLLQRTEEARSRDLGHLHPYATHFIFYYDKDHEPLITSIPRQLRSYGISMVLFVPHGTISDIMESSTFADKKIPIVMFKNAGGPVEELIGRVEFANEAISVKDDLERSVAAGAAPKGAMMKGPLVKFLEKWGGRIMSENGRQALLTYLPIAFKVAGAGGKKKKAKAAADAPATPARATTPGAGEEGDVSPIFPDGSGNIARGPDEGGAGGGGEESRPPTGHAHERGHGHSHGQGQNKQVGFWGDATTSLSVNPQLSTLPVKERLERLKKFIKVYTTYCPYKIPPDAELQDLVPIDILKDQAPANAQAQLTRLLQPSGGNEEMGMWITEKKRIYEAWSVVARFTLNKDRQMNLARGLQYAIVFVNLFITILSIARTELAAATMVVPNLTTGVNETVPLMGDVEALVLQISYVAFPVVSSVMLTVLSKFNPLMKSTQLRSGAELIRSEIFKYRAKVVMVEKVVETREVIAAVVTSRRAVVMHLQKVRSLVRLSTAASVKSPMLP